MPRTETITCDAPGCGRDLTSSGNCVDYRLALVNEHVPSRAGAVTLMHKTPSLDRDHYFCGLACLLKWAAAGHGDYLCGLLKEGGA